MPANDAREKLLAAVVGDNALLCYDGGGRLKEGVLLALEAVAEILSRAYDQPFDPIKAIHALAEEVRCAR